MTTTYTVPGWLTWTTFRTQPAATHWTGQGTLDDPWIIAPADDIWGWFVGGIPSSRRKPRSVAMTPEYSHSHLALTTAILSTERFLLHAGFFFYSVELHAASPAPR